MFSDLVIKSYKKKYTVKYVDTISGETLQPLSNEFLVIDENINNLYPHIESASMRIKHIFLGLVRATKH